MRAVYEVEYRIRPAWSTGEYERFAVNVLADSVEEAKGLFTRNITDEEDAVIYTTTLIAEIHLENTR